MNFIDWYLLMILSGMFLSMPCFFFDLKGFQKGHRLIFSILVLVSIVELSGGHLANQGITNHWVYNIGFVYGETILILFFFSLILKSHQDRIILRLTAILFGLYGSVNILFFKPIDIFHNYSLTIGSMLIIFGSFYFFYQVLYRDQYLDEELWHVPEFWVVAFFLLFYSSSMLYFTFLTNVIALDDKLSRLLNLVLNMIAAIMYLVFGLVYYLPLLKRKKADE